MKKYLMISFLLCILFIQGCQSPLLDSSIAIKDSILPEYIQLVKESPKYTELEKRYRIRNAECYKKVIEEAAEKR